MMSDKVYFVEEGDVWQTMFLKSFSLHLFGRQASHPFPESFPKRAKETERAEQNHSILLTIGACFVSYAGHFKTIRLFMICPAFSSLNL
jgi:hypothetical protein